MGRISFTLVLAILIAANLALGGAAFVARPPWPVVAPGLPPRPPTQVEELRAAVNAGRHGEPYALELSDADLTAVANWTLATRPSLPFARAAATVTDRVVIVEGVTRGLAVPVPVRARVAVGAADGLPEARIVDFSVVGVAPPAIVRDRVLRDANASLDFSRYDLPVTVEVVDLRPGWLTVRGTVK